MNEELKPCPFCGGTVNIALKGDGEREVYFITRGDGENRCKCRVFTESEVFYADDYSEEEKEGIKRNLIKSWNRRVCACRQNGN